MNIRRRRRRRLVHDHLRRVLRRIDEEGAADADREQRAEDEQRVDRGEFAPLPRGRGTAFERNVIFYLQQLAQWPSRVRLNPRRTFTYGIETARKSEISSARRPMNGDYLTSCVEDGRCGRGRMHPGCEPTTSERHHNPSSLCVHPARPMTIPRQVTRNRHRSGCVPLCRWVTVRR